MMVAEPVEQTDARRLTEEVSAIASRLSVTKLMSALDYLRYLSEDDEDEGLALSPEALADIAAYRAGDTTRAVPLEEAWGLLDGQ